jgi:hypothetical protein
MTSNTIQDVMPQIYFMVYLETLSTGTQYTAEL